MKLLYYYFLNDVIKNIEPKYQKIINQALDKTYLYANFQEVLSYYNLLSINKNHNYQIYERVKNTKGQEALDFLKKETINHQYNENYLLFLIAFISNKILNNYLNGFLTLTKKKDLHLKYLELYIYQKKTNNKTYKKFNQVKFFEKSLTLTDTDKEIVKDLLAKVYFFSYGIKHFELSLKKYKNLKQQYQKDFLGIKGLYLSILAKIKHDNKIKYLIKNPKNNHDLLNEQKNHWKYLDTLDKTLTFDELYQEALDTSIKLINQICDEIFYNKTIKKGLANFF